MTIVSCIDVMKFRSSGFALGPLSLSIEAGEIIGLIGANGAGKTTLMKLLVGLIKPSSGKVVYSFPKPQAKIGYLPDHVQMYDWMRVTEILEFVAKFYPRWDHTFCQQLIQKLELDTGKKFRELSHGMKVKLGLICALAHRPKLLLLDEPTIGLDPLIKRSFLQTILDFVGQNPCAVVFSSHALDEVSSIATRVILLKAGKICKDASMESIRRVSSFTDWFWQTYEAGGHL
jgi:ABC-2 type transport system ATP-binding protein